MRRAGFVLPLVGVALLLSACSSASGGDASNALASPAAAGGSSDFAAYRQCLSEHGVDLPQGGPGAGTRPSGMPTDRPSGVPTDRPSGAPSGFPSGGQGGTGGGRGGMRIPDGVDESTWAAAQTACASLAPARPDGARGGPSGQVGGNPGGTGQGGSGTTPSSAPTSVTSAYTVFWQCMADHDVSAPASGKPADLDSTDAEVAEARKICDPLLPASGS